MGSNRDNMRREALSQERHRADREAITIQNVAASDAEAMAGIYTYFVTETIITFEEVCVSSSEMRRRIERVRSDALPWFVAEQSGEIAGYAYASKWKERSAYRFCVEVTVYVKPGLEGKGIGSKLFSRLLDDLRHRGVHVAIGVIALPNQASIALHEKFGFRKAAHFKEVGFKFNQWIDVGDWQLIL